MSLLLPLSLAQPTPNATPSSEVKKEAHLNQTLTRRVEQSEMFLRSQVAPALYQSKSRQVHQQIGQIEI